MLGRWLASITVLVLLAVFASGPAHASSGPNGFSVQGVLSDPSGSVYTGTVVFKVQILDKNAACVLYEESHNLNLGPTNGAFSLDLGSGTSKSNKIDSSGALNARVFRNDLNVPVSADCGTGVTMAAGDPRLVRILFNVGSGETAMSPDLTLRGSPYSSIAETVQGKAPADFVQIDSGRNITQTNIETVFNGTNYADLVALILGTSTKYMKATPTGPVAVNGQVISNVGTPSAATDAATKGYADTRLGGADATSVTGLTGGDSGKVISWDGTKWVATNPAASAGDFKSDGSVSMTGTIRAADGGLSLPGLSFGTEQMGLYRSAPGILKAKSSEFVFTAAGGADVASLSTSGIIAYYPLVASSAIGPIAGAALTVEDLAGASQGIAFRNNPNDWWLQTNGGRFEFREATTVRMAISGGNVGVGTTVPATALDVNGTVKLGTGTCSASTQGSLQFSGGNVQFCSTANTWVSLGSGSGDVFKGGNIQGSGTMVVGTNDALPFAIETNNTPRLYIDENGNVGVGTAVPSTRFEAFRLSVGTSGVMTTANAINSVQPAGVSSGTYNAFVGGSYLSNGSPAAMVSGVTGWSEHLGTGTATSLRGVYGVAAKTSSGDVTDAVGGQFQATSSGTGTINRAYGIEVDIARSSGTIQNGYGVYIGPVQATNKYSLFASDVSAWSFFAGAVGIGTSLPQTALDVNGTVKLGTGNCGATTQGSLQFSGGNIQYCNTSNVWTTLGTGSGSGDVARGGNTQSSGTMIVGTNDAFPLAFETNNTNRLFIAPNGDIGIGTVPSYNLHMVKSGFTHTMFEADGGNNEVDIMTYGAGTQPMLFLSGARGTKAAPTYLQAGDSVGYFAAAASQSGLQSARIQFFATENWTSATGAGNMVFSTTSSGTTVPTERMRIESNGRVGIGTNNPQTTLDVSGSIKLGTGTCAAATQGSLQFSGGNIQYCNTSNVWTTLASGGGSQWATSGSNISYTTGNVGIGTTSPTYLLDVIKSQDAETAIHVKNGNGGVSAEASLVLENEFGAGYMSMSSANNLDGAYANRLAVGANQLGLSLLATDTNGTIQMYTGGFAAANERLRVSAIGNIGVGTTAPATKLDVNGSVKLGTGTCAASTQGSLQFSGGAIQFCNTSNAWTSLGVGTGDVTIGGNTVASTMTIGTNSSHALGFETGGATRVTIGTNGWVGIGTTATVGTLEVQGTTDDLVVGIKNTAIAGNSLLQLEGPLSTNTTSGKAFSVNVGGEGFGRAMFYTDGKYGVGGGTATRDVFLSRAAANQFKISSDAATGAADLLVTGKIGVGTTVTTYPIHAVTAAPVSTDPTIAATNINSTSKASIQAINNTGAYAAVGINGNAYAMPAFANAAGFTSANASKTVIVTDEQTGTGGTAPLHIITGGFNNAPTVAVTAGSSGLVGIGTTAPTTKLDVNGSIKLGTGSCGATTQGSLQFSGGNIQYCNTSNVWTTLGGGGSGDVVRGGNTQSSGTMTVGTNDAFPLALETNGTNRLYIDSGGNVGVGTIPSYKFHIVTTTATNQITQESTTGGSVFLQKADGNSAGYTQQSIGNVGYIAQQAAGSGWTNVVDGQVLGVYEFSGYQNSGFRVAAKMETSSDGTPSGSAVPGRITFHTASGGTQSERMRITSGGNVGIGVTNPVTALQVGGSIKFGTGTCGATTQGSLQFSGGVIQYCNTSNVWTTLAAGGGSGDVVRGGNTQSSGTMTIGTNDTFPLAFEVGGTSRVFITATGVGIDTPTPTGEFDVNGQLGNNGNVFLGSGGADFIAFDADPTTVGGAISFHNGGTDIMHLPTGSDARAGRVGIGTTAPNARLEVNGAIRIGNDATACSATNVGAIRFGGASIEYCVANNWVALGTGVGDVLLGGNTTSGTMSLGTNSNFPLQLETNGSARIHIDTSGSVGIGTTVPTTGVILDVNGTGTRSAMMLPRDTTANRPTGVEGMIRYNSTTKAVETFQDGNWGGIVRVVASQQSLNNQANISAQTLITPTADGLYRATCYIVLTQAATTSATLPGCTISYTDADTNQAANDPVLTPVGANSVGTTVTSDGLFYAKSGVAITWSTSGYLSSGATPMRYTIRIRLEHLP